MSCTDPRLLNPPGMILARDGSQTRFMSNKAYQMMVSPRGNRRGAPPLESGADYAFTPLGAPMPTSGFPSPGAPMPAFGGGPGGGFGGFGGGPPGAGAPPLPPHAPPGGPPLPPGQPPPPGMPPPPPGGNASQPAAKVKTKKNFRKSVFAPAAMAPHLPRLAGYLEKRTTGLFSRWVERWFITKTHYLEYFDDHTDPDSGSEPLGAFDLTFLYDVVETGPNSFELWFDGAGKTKLSLRSAEAEDKSKWVDGLRIMMELLMD